jgi:hypothetical protein
MIIAIIHIITIQYILYTINNTINVDGFDGDKTRHECQHVHHHLLLLGYAAMCSLLYLWLAETGPNPTY